ncbi:MAG: hypothetical protein WBP86_04390, partial [Thiobacillaceae bacterium]
LWITGRRWSESQRLKNAIREWGVHECTRPEPPLDLGKFSWCPSFRGFNSTCPHRASLNLDFPQVPALMIISALLSLTSGRQPRK